MPRLVAENVIRSAIMEINAWPENTPLILVFSKQTPGEGGDVWGNTDAVRAVYDELFNLEQIGIGDPARRFYLHLCHKERGTYPYAIRKPSSNYGKTHQRIIKDTFANPDGFLVRLGPGRYRLKEDFSQRVLHYLGKTEAIDLRPLILFRYWNQVDLGQKMEGLWQSFAKEFGLDQPPFTAIFNCSGLNEEIPLEPESAKPYSMKHLCLPNLYGSGSFDVEFWKRFQDMLAVKLREMKWQGDITSLSASVTSALMQDQALFLLGLPGTGKTTIVIKAILPALRAAIGAENELMYSEYTITPVTTQTDLYGFQGLDGNWIPGQLTKQLLKPYTRVDLQPNVKEQTPCVDDPDGVAKQTVRDDEAYDQAENDKVDTVSDEAQPPDIPHLLFFDEANRIDIEGLLSPLQTAFDRMQRREDPGVVVLGKSEYTLPSRVWRIFAGNSPVADIGRREQSRPLKRRLPVVIPPDPLESILDDSQAFRRMCLELLLRAVESTDPEVSEPANSLYGVWKDSDELTSKFRNLLGKVRKLPQVAVTVGLVESILLRAAAYKALDRESPVDESLCQSLLGLLAGENLAIQEIASTAKNIGFTKLASAIEANVIGNRTGVGFELGAIL